MKKYLLICEAMGARIAIIIYVMLFSWNATAKNLDSLYNVWKNTGDSTIAFEINRSIVQLMYNYPDSALHISKKCLSLAKLNNNKRLIGRFKNNIGGCYFVKGNFVKASKHYHSSLKTYEEANDSLAYILTLSNLASVYFKINNERTAKSYLFTCINFLENSPKKQEKVLGNLYHNLAAFYNTENKLDSAIYYLNKSAKHRKIENDSVNLATIYTVLSKTYLGKHEFDSSYKYIVKAKQILEEKAPNSVWNMHNYVGIGEYFYLLQQKDSAIQYFTRALKLSYQMGLAEHIMANHDMLQKIYADKEMYDSAYFHDRKFMIWRDSVNNIQKTKEIVTKQMTFEHEKAKALQEQEHKSEIMLAKEREEKQKIMIYTSVLGLLALLAILVLIINRFRITRKQKLTIEKQKILVDEKNKEVTDSITYAKRIQSAILPSNSVIKSLWKNSFVFFQPKDIVSGDFYWYEKAPNGNTLIAAIDCTGHGVPGAFMSIVGYNILSKAVSEYGLNQPSKILDFLHHNVQKTLQAENTEVKDGMDLSLISLSPAGKSDNTQSLEFAGAMNPLYYIRNNELHEIKGDKMAIGSLNKNKSFTNHQIELNKGDSIYLFTDGFADQFGGIKGKKYKYKPFKDVLLSIHKKPMAEQNEILAKEFNEWKGDLEQIDDVCVIGIKL